MDLFTASDAKAKADWYHSGERVRVESRTYALREVLPSVADKIKSAVAVGEYRVSFETDGFFDTELRFYAGEEYDLSAIDNGLVRAIVDERLADLGYKVTRPTNKQVVIDWEND